MNNKMNLTDSEESKELNLFYPIIHKNIFKENQIINENENKNTETLKNKTKSNFLINNLETQKNKQNISKSLKVFKKDNKYQKLINKKLQNFFNNNTIINKKRINNNKKNILIKKDKNIKNNTFDGNINIKDNKNEMKDLLYKLMKLKQKINEINSIKKPKFNNNDINKKKHNAYKSSGKLNYRNNRINNFENKNSNNEFNKYKTEIIFNSPNKKNDSYKRHKITLKLPLDNNLHTKNYKKIKNEFFILNKRRYNTYKNVNYLIKRKNELIIDKYRNEYLNKIDTYKYNTQKILKAIKYHNYYTFNDEKTDYKNINKSENNINKSSIKIKLAQKINDINSNKNNNVTNYNIDDKYESIFK